MNNSGTNRRQEVDEIVNQLTKGKSIELFDVTSSLMESFRVLDKISENERDALKQVIASNVLLSKVVGILAKDILVLQREVETLKRK